MTGGTRKGFEYDGLTQMLRSSTPSAPSATMAALFNASLLNIHGRSLSADNLQTLQTASGIEADRGTRLWELWYEQKFLDEDRLDVKVGQQSLDQEFMVSQNALLLRQHHVRLADAALGRPARRRTGLSALGARRARAAARPVDARHPPRRRLQRQPGDERRQQRPAAAEPSRHELSAATAARWRSRSAVLLPRARQHGRCRAVAAAGWTYRLGAWYDSKAFADQRFDNAGLSLANPASSGVPQPHRGDYALLRRRRPAGLARCDGADRTVEVFGRVMGTPERPQPDRLQRSTPAGFHEPFLHRDADTFGIGMGYAHVSRQAAAWTGTPRIHRRYQRPVRGSETFVELTYQYQVTPWLQVQPDLQYVFNPGGGVAEPTARPALGTNWWSACAPISFLSSAPQIMRQPTSADRACDVRAVLAALRSMRLRRRRADEPRGMLETIHQHRPYLDDAGQRRRESLRRRRRPGLGRRDREGRRAGRQLQQHLQPARHRHDDHRLSVPPPRRPSSSRRCRRI